MLQGLGILLKQNSMSKVTKENKELFYKELMKYFMYPKYFGYMKENYRYSFVNNCSDNLYIYAFCERAWLDCYIYRKE